MFIAIQFRAHQHAGERKPLTLGYLEFEGFEVIQTVETTHPPASWTFNKHQRKFLWLTKLSNRCSLSMTRSEMSSTLTGWYNTKCPVCNAGIEWQLPARPGRPGWRDRVS